MRRSDEDEAAATPVFRRGLTPITHFTLDRSLGKLRMQSWPCRVGPHGLNVHSHLLVCDDPPQESARMPRIHSGLHGPDPGGQRNFSALTA